MGKIIIIHGTGGSPSGNWFPWLSNELRTLGYSTLVPKMPTPENQSLSSWFDAFSELGIVPDKSTIIVGHSVGAVFLLRLLERMSTPLMASVFVAGFTGVLNLPEFDTLNASFIENKYDWNQIKKNAGEIECFSGEDDPYVPKSQGLELARNLGVTPTLIENGGHLNAASGYLTFPVLLNKLKKLLG